MDDYRKSRTDLLGEIERLRASTTKLDTVEADRRSAEHALQESQERFRDLVESLSDVVYALDASGVITYTSPAIEAVLGYSPSDVVGKPISDFLHPDDLETMRENVRSILDGEAHSSNEYRLIDSNGQTRWVRTSSCRVMTEDGFTGMRGVLADITEQRELEERLRQFEKMQAIGQLAGGIAHDFNNQLTAIMGCADMLRRDLKGNSDQAAYVEIILQASRRSADMANQLLAFARKGRFRSVVVNIHDVVREVTGLLERSIDKSIEIRRALKAETPTVMGDPGQLQSALLNVAINACDAMPEGGAMTFSTRNVSLDEARCKQLPYKVKPGKYVEITVCDTGVGMDDDTLKRVFEPFFTTKREGHGTGMGLAAAYGTVKNHAGVIEVESVLGMGSEFRIFLPESPGEAHVKLPHDRGEPPPAARPAAILVVDDEPLVRDAAVKVLRSLGHHPVGCGSGKEALAYFRKSWREVDLVILDLIMPEMSGYSTFHAIRKIDPDAKVVLISGYSLNNEAQELLEMGAVSFVQKPFQIAALAAKLNESLA